MKHTGVTPDSIKLGFGRVLFLLITPLKSFYSGKTARKSGSKYAPNKLGAYFYFCFSKNCFVNETQILLLKAIYSLQTVLYLIIIFSTCGKFCYIVPK